MKLKLNLNYNSIFLYITIIILLLTTVSLYFVYGFIKNNVYNTIFQIADSTLAGTKQLDSDINVDKFKSLIDKIEAKAVARDYQSLRNIFD